MADVTAEMVANVWKVLVAEGDRVVAGQELMILESMKMEIPIESPVTGQVESLRVQADQSVAEGDVLAVVASE